MFQQFPSKLICAFKSSCHFRQMSVLAKCLKYSKYGEPSEVLKIYEEEIPDPRENEVLVKILAAPINPSDYITIQGFYAVKPKLPAVAGNEFVGDIVSIGKNVSNLVPGDRVIITNTLGIGSWTSHGVYPAKLIKKISNKMGIVEAATISINPCTAYRMLKDFVNLKPGDTVIQNGANSAVGQAVHQLCKAWNILSVGVVRDRPDIAELKAHLKSLGATEVLTEEELTKTDLFKGKLPKPKLGFNCVGGKSATQVARYLNNKGVLVTYGGMSGEQVIAGVPAMIFNDISYVGFWVSTWSKENLNSEKEALMFAELYKLFGEGKLTAPPYEMISLDNYKDAVNGALNFKGFRGKKFILDFQN